MWNASDHILPPPGATPFTLPWNVILLVVYLPAIVLLYMFTAARKAHNFSEGGWTALFVVRIVEGLLGLVTPLAYSKGNLEARKYIEWYLNLPCSLLHDLGTFCIILSLTRALFHALDLWELTFVNTLRRLWGWIMVLLPIPGYIFVAIVMTYTYGAASGINSDLQTFYREKDNEHAFIAYSILRVNIISLGATLLSMIPFFLYVFIKRRKGQFWASSTASSTATIFFPTLVLMTIYLVNDMLRFIVNRNPSLKQHFALSLAPECLVTALWLALARAIGKCDKSFIWEQDGLREAQAQIWDNEINRARDAHTNGVKIPKEKYSSTEQTLEGVYDCTLYRLERLQQDYTEDAQRATRDYREEVRLLVEDAKENVVLIAACLVPAPCEDHPLFDLQFFPSNNSESGRRPRFLSEKTAKKVLEVLKKDNVMKILNDEELEWAVNDIVKIYLS